MSTVRNHVEITQLDSSGNLNIMYPKTTSSDVVLNFTNTSVPSSIVSGTSTVSDITSKLATAAFGNVGTASGKVITTTTSGVMQASTQIPISK